MNNKLDRIEAKLKAFFEKSAQLTPGHQRQLYIAEQLVSAMRNEIENSPEGSPVAPGAYRICMHPHDLEEWQQHPEWKDALLHTLQDAALESGVRFKAPLAISTTADPLLTPNFPKVCLDAPSEMLGRTAAMPLDAPLQENAQISQAITAFLILEDKRIIPLANPVINLGRMLDNQVAIEDPRVSRRHAQLRNMQNHFVIFDLNSTGGTYVNGQRIQQATLKPGDVISLAGFPLIYGEDSDHFPGLDQTGSMLSSLNEEDSSTESGAVS
jgi:hypothetical protein